MTSGLWSAIVTLAIFVISNIAALVYWSAKISTLLGVLQNEVRDLTIELRTMRESYVTKEAFAYRLAQSDKDHDAMWKRLDVLTERTS